MKSTKVGYALFEAHEFARNLKNESFRENTSPLLL